MRDSQLALLAKTSTVTPVFGFILALMLLLPGALPAQTTNTGSIAGKVREENGAAMRAIVTATSGAFVQRAFPASDGSFQFTKLPAGSFYLCAQVPGMMVGPKEDPFLDACASRDHAAPLVSLAAGQSQNTVVTVKRGYLLQVRVNDPGALLTSAIGKPGDPGVVMMIWSASAPPRFVPVTAKDAGGRTHSIVIPYDTPHKLVVQSEIAGLKDATGRDLNGASPIDVSVLHGASLPPVVVNVVKAAVVKP